ncbi:MAG: hypothetical protein U0528_12480 [Anaerolineae bacterium]
MKRLLYRLISVSSALILLAACQPQGLNSTGAQSTNSPIAITPVVATLPPLSPTAVDPGLLIVATESPQIDAIKYPKLYAYVQQIQQALQQPNPILLLSGDLSDEQKQAQNIAISDPRLQQITHESKSQASFRMEVFGIYPLRESDITEATIVCRQATCYRVEMYNYALNLYLGAVVNLNPSGVLSISELPDTQPDVPQQLVDVALEIVRNAPEVEQALGYIPDSEQALMANTKTALNRTRCERSQHLCLAPTFIVGERALWTIVDLTDFRLVGLRWTTVGNAGPPLTEKQLIEDSITRLYCDRSTTLERAGWQMDYILTGSDGLRISNVLYRGTPILESAKLVDWHVSYSQTDGFGYSDAVGCPIFSQAAVIAVLPPQIKDIFDGDQVIGFALEQEYWSELWPLPCNYFYVQRYEFYLDGRFRPVVASVGRGCGNDGTYRPVTRLALAREATFAEWTGGDWKDWANEGWKLQLEVSVAADGSQYRVIDAAGQGFTIEPGRGQFGDGGRGDNSYIFVTLHHWDRDEGDSDMPTIGPCCNTDYQQGPEKFIDSTPEPISNSALVIWYVAQMKNDDTPGSQYCWAEAVVSNGVFTNKEYPCYSGPMFHPLKSAASGANQP